MTTRRERCAALEDGLNALFSPRRRPKRTKPQPKPMTAEEKRERIAAIRASAHKPDCASLAIARTYQAELCDCGRRQRGTHD